MNNTALDRALLSRYERGFQFCCVSGFIITCVGLVANFLVYKTSRRLDKKYTCTHLIGYLAVWDSIAAFQDGVMNLGLDLLGLHPADNVNSVICKLFHYHSWASSMTANFHVVALALDRVVAIYAPFWHKTHSSENSAMKMSFACAIFNYLVVAPNFYIFKVMDGTCQIDFSHGVQLLGIYLNTINYGLFSGAPFIILFVSNIVFLVTLAKYKNNRNEKLNKSSPSKSSLPPTSRDESTLDKSKLDSGKYCSVYCGDTGNSLEMNSSMENDGKLTSKTNGNLLSPNDLGSSLIEEHSNIDDEEKQPMTQKISKRSATVQFVKSKASSMLSLSDKKSREKKRSQDRAIIIMLMVISCSFLLLTATTGALNVASIGVTGADEVSQARRNLISASAEIPIVINNSINFFFYFASFASFRNSFIAMVRS